ncbi:hypothetical protein K502DRAFT_324176 [Neoconidiobolus thromboides FSU 785]|nr:hypothetical protein K502DRAFT_324176 [Neoconidiobolus thromboides FSU 785]
MAVSTNIARLCRQIISQQFGSIIERVAMTLVNRGRLSLNLLIKFSKLTNKQVRESLFILMQHGLVTYYDLPEGTKFVTYYTLETDCVLDRLGLLNVLEIAEERYSREGYLIAKTFCLNGKLRFRDLEGYLEEEINGKKDQNNNSNNNSSNNEQNVNSDRISLENMRATFMRMVESKFIETILPLSSQTKLDHSLEEEHKVVQSLGVLPSDQKKKRAIAASKAAKLEALQESLSTIGTKRQLNGNVGDKNSRRKIKVKEEEEENLLIDKNTHYMISFKRAQLFIRNKHIMEYANQRINKGAMEVMCCFITHIENRIYGFNDKLSPPANSSDIQEHLNPEARLSTYMAIPNNNQANENNNTNNQMNGNYSNYNQMNGNNNNQMNGNNNNIMNNDNIRARNILLISEFIRLLNRDEIPLLVEAKERGIMGRYCIDFVKIGYAIKLNFMEVLIKRKFDVVAWRLIRILMLKGRMDEKQISKVAIIPGSTCRKLLNEMAVHGFISLQEVPKTVNREPSRTIYLWEFKIEKAFESILSHLQQSIGNLMDRRLIEMESRSTLIDKINREDVKNDLSLLSKNDHLEFNKLNQTLDQIDIAHMNLVQWLTAFQYY